LPEKGGNWLGRREAAAIGDNQREKSPPPSSEKFSGGMTKKDRGKCRGEKKRISLPSSKRPKKDSALRG